MKVLLLGASLNPERTAYLAALRLQAAGHSLYLLGARPGTLMGLPLHTEWPQPSDFTPHTVTLYLGPAAQPLYRQAILASQAQRVVFNPGTENPDFENALTLAGKEALRACTLVLLASGTF